MTVWLQRILSSRLSTGLTTSKHATVDTHTKPPPPSRNLKGFISASPISMTRLVLKILIQIFNITSSKGFLQFQYVWGMNKLIEGIFSEELCIVTTFTKEPEWDDYFPRISDSRLLHLGIDRFTLNRFLPLPILTVFEDTDMDFQK